MKTKRAICDLIQQRFSCRNFSSQSIPGASLSALQSILAERTRAPLGSSMRFELVAAAEGDLSSLKGLGTYGTIQGARAFIVGATGDHEYCLEDYGYVMEEIILLATDLELGTCWLGGFFTRSSFSQRMRLEKDEQIPAVTALGLIADPEKARQTIMRRLIGSIHRLPWEALFFIDGFERPLPPEEAGAYKTALEMLRWAPSASNRQPWRVIKAGSAWHFYLRRTPGYRRNILARLMNFSDLQRVDMGIAMCHFELTLKELGVSGRWKMQDPQIEKRDPASEYCVTWEET